MTTIATEGFNGEDVSVELPYIDEYGTAENTFGSKLVGRYLACWCMYADTDTGWAIDYLADYENGELFDAHRGIGYPAYYDGKNWIGFDEEDDPRQWFYVDKYEHGQVHYSLANTENYPDRRWDVSSGIIYVPPDDLQEQYNKDKYKRGGKVTARSKLAEYAAAVLSEYTSWRNGDVYGLCSWIADAKTGEMVKAEDACWGFIGYKYAQEELKSFERAAIEEAIKLEATTRRELVEEYKQVGVDALELHMGQVGTFNQLRFV